MALNRFRADTRGLTMGFVQLIMSLGLGAACLWIFYEIGDPLLEDAAAAAPGGMGGLDMNNWFVTLGEIGPAIFLFCAFSGFIAKAVYERGAI